MRIYVCMFNNNKGLKKSNKVTLHLVIFFIEFSHRWLRISKTTDHTKLLESKDYLFKVFVILRKYRQKRQFQEVQCDTTKIQPNVTKCLKTYFPNHKILA